MNNSSARTILGYLGFIVMIVGFITMLPLLVLCFFPEEVNVFNSFFFPGIVSVFLGFICSRLINRKDKGVFRPHQEAVVVLSAWVVTILVSVVPWLINGEYTFSQAFFEMTSGYTTTGLTIVNVAKLPKAFLLYRSLTMFLGGVGLTVVLMSVLNVSHGMRVFNAEGHKDRLLPNLIKSARVIFTIYTVYILSGTVIYKCLGMTWFDGLNHSISAFATGGFSTHPDSMNHYDSLAIDVATIVFMLLGSITFALHWLLCRGKIKAFFTHCEMKLTFLLIVFCAPIIAFLGVYNAGLTLPKSFRYAIFDIVSVFSTTGYYSGPNLAAFSMPAVFIFILLMFVGGQSGSTSGGIKQYRIVIGLKSIWWQLRDMFLNKRIITVNTANKYGKTEIVTQTEMANCSLFIFIYVIIAMAGSFVYMLQGYNIQDSLFEFASAIGNIGYSVGIINPSSNALTLWTGTFGMLIGRLEVLIMFMGIGSIISSVKRRLV